MSACKGGLYVMNEIVTIVLQLLYYRAELSIQFIMISTIQANKLTKMCQFYVLSFK